MHMDRHVPPHANSFFVALTDPVTPTGLMPGCETQSPRPPLSLEPPLAFGVAE